MHYKNGREAHNGDKVLLIPSYGAPVAGILYDAVAGNDTCNGMIAPTSPNDPCPNLKEVLHIEDVSKATVPDSTSTRNDFASADTQGKCCKVPETTDPKQFQD